MAKKLIATRFAPSERADERVLRQQSKILSDQSLLIDVLNAVSTLLVILNKERQIVFGNKAFLDLLEVDGLKDITSLRVGEVMRCEHANKTEGGCGTTDFCRMCGAVNAMLSAQQGNTEVQECRISQENGGKAFDLRVMASPFHLDEEEFTMFSILDIADEKRKDVLERIFMHDLLNTAGGLRGFSSLLTTASEDDLNRYSVVVNSLANKLVDEIEAHKQLMQAENEGLEIQVVPIHTLELLKGIQETFVNHEVAKDRKIIIDPEAGDHIIFSDHSLLRRVIGNMCKNALEAIEPGDTVTLTCHKREDKIRFSVLNPGEIPQEVGLQIFQRSFSTKGSGRGLGTYGVKLLSEQYLNGKVGFTTSPVEGTVFYGEYPESI